MARRVVVEQVVNRLANGPATLAQLQTLLTTQQRDALLVQLRRLQRLGLVRTDERSYFHLVKG